MAVGSGPLVQTMDLPSMLQSHITAKLSQSLAVLDLPSQHQAEAGTEPSSQLTSVYASPPVIPLVEVEKRAIMDALTHTKGDRAVAAGLPRDRKDYYVPKAEGISSRSLRPVPRTGSLRMAVFNAARLPED